MEDKKYLDGYNQGYRLNLYSPELFDKLKDSLNAENEYESGLLEGALEADKERERQRLKQLQSLTADKDKENEKEGEMER